jgi:hypothetical protein
MKMKKKNYIPLILIIIFIIILIIVLTKIHKKDKFDYSDNSITNLKGSRNYLTLKYFNYSGEPSFVLIGIVNAGKFYTSLIGGVFEPGTESKAINYKINMIEPPFLLIIDRVVKQEIDPAFDYNIIEKPGKNFDVIATIPGYTYKSTDPIFKLVNRGDITFEYTITLFDSNNKAIFYVSNDKCNNGKGFVSNYYSVPENSKVTISYNSCSLPDFERTINFICKPKSYYQITQINTYSFWRGVWFPSLTLQSVLS